MKAKKFFLFLILLLINIGVVSAFSTLSLDKVNFLSNDPTLNHPAFQLLGVENGGSQYAVYSLSDLSSALPDDYKLVGDGTISSELTNYEIHYPVEIVNAVYGLQDLGTKWSLTEPDDWCFNDLNGFWIAKNSGSTTWHCFGLIIYGYYSNILEGQHKFTDIIKVRTSNGGYDEITLTDSDKSGSTKIGNNRKIIAQVQGAITNFADVPRPDLERDAYFTSSNNKWHLINKISSNEFDNYYSYNALVNWLTEECDSNNPVDDCPAGWEQRIEYAFREVDYNKPSVESYSLRDGELIITPTQIYKYPLFTLTIDADWVGIVKLVGKPEILSIDAPNKIIEGVANTLQAKIKNDADVKASFIFDWSCSGPVSVQTINVQPFSAGETRTITFNVYGQTSSGCEAGSCKLIVKDYENPDSQDSERIDLKVCEANQCDIEGSQRCLQNTIQECRNENGVLVWHNIKNCLYGCELDDGFGICKDESNSEVPVCGDEVCVELERQSDNKYYCPADCSSPTPVCGDGICDYRERPGGEYECLQPKGDCPAGTSNGTSSSIIIAGVLGGLMVAGTFVLRLKRSGYL